MQSQYRKWLQKEIIYLEKHAKTKGFNQIAIDLNRTERAVKLKAFKLGIKGQKAQWSEQELDLIEELAGLKSLNLIAEKLGRPKSGVWMKMVELGCADFHLEAGTYSAKALGEIIGVSSETVRRWILNKGLPARKRGRQYYVDKRYMSYHISSEDFWKWAKKNTSIVEFNKIERDILPPEPDWVEEERRKQFYRPAKQKVWTEEEDEKLLRMYYKEALKQREIAERLGRTKNSIEKRLRLLRRKEAVR